VSTGSTRSLWLIDAYNVLRVSLANCAATPDGGDPPREPSEPAEPWWSQSRREYLIQLAAGLQEPNAEIWLIFDARHLLEAEEMPQEMTEEIAEPANRVRVVFAPSADEWIVSAVKKASKNSKNRENSENGENSKSGENEANRGSEQKTASATRVVTADRVLANRVRSRGATIVATNEFVALCQQPHEDPGGR
jgi:hypothetical protein